MSQPEALVVISGGLDSSVALWLAHNRHQGRVAAISFHYRQKHSIELEYAKRMCALLKVAHGIYNLPQWSFHTALTSDREVPEGHYAEDNMKQTVVPNRNSIMLNIAAGIAIDIGAEYVYTGVHAGDHPIYPDCRPEFITSLNQLLYVANEGFKPPHIVAPFMEYEKSDIVSKGRVLGVPFEETWSCYKGGAPGVQVIGPDVIHCGRCSTCVERQEAFHIAKVTDPTQYNDPAYWKTVVNV